MVPPYAFTETSKPSGRGCKPRPASDSPRPERFAAAARPPIPLLTETFKRLGRGCKPRPALSSGRGAYPVPPERSAVSTLKRYKCCIRCP